MHVKRIPFAGLVVLLLVAAPAALFSYDNSPKQQIIIPECIWASASGGGTWVTELQITAWQSGTTITATFFYGTSYRVVHNFWTSPGIYRSFKQANILQYLHSLDPSFDYYGRVGTLLLSSQDVDHRIQAQAKTVNGNYGKTYPGLAWVDSNSANLGRGMIIPNLTQNATYRSFVGFANMISGGFAMTVEFTIIDENNNAVGSPFYKTFSAWEFKSFNPFVEAGAGTGTYDNCWLYIYPTASGNSNADAAGLFCFGSVANNASNDSSAQIAVQLQ